MAGFQDPNTSSDRLSSQARTSADSQASAGRRPTTTPHPNPRRVNYPVAGFGWRFTSATLDCSIMYLLAAILTAAVSKIFVFGLSMWIARYLNQFSSLGGLGFFALLATVIFVLAILVQLSLLGLIYMSVFESSSLQATPGKFILGLKLVRPNGSAVGFSRAVARHCLRMISLLFFNLGFWLLLFSRRKQTLYDQITDIEIVRVRQVSPFFGFCMFVVGILIAVGTWQIFGDQDRANFSFGPTDLGNRKKVTRKLNSSDRPAQLAVPTDSASPSVKPSPGFIPAPMANSSPLPTTSPLPEIPKVLPAAPFGELRVNNSDASIHTTLAFYYPATNEVAIGFFTSPPTDAVRDELMRRRNVTTAVNRERADFVLYLKFAPGATVANEASLISYTAYFYDNPGSSFVFRSALGAASVSKKKEQFRAGEFSRLSGHLGPGGKIEVGMDGSATPAKLPVVFAWRVHYVVELH